MGGWGWGQPSSKGNAVDAACYRLLPLRRCWRSGGWLSTRGLLFLAPKETAAGGPYWADGGPSFLVLFCVMFLCPCGLLRELGHRKAIVQALYCPRAAGHCEAFKGSTEA